MLAARRRRGDGARRGQGHRAADAQAVRGLPRPRACRCSRSSTSTTARAASRSSCSTRSRSRSGCARRRSPGRSASPATSAGVIDRRTGEFTRFTRTARGATIAAEETRAAPTAPRPRRARRGRRRSTSAALLDAVGADVDVTSFLAGESTPVFVGSALTNFGVRMLLDAVDRPGAVAVAATRRRRRAAAARRAVLGVRVQGAGQHGPVAPRPHRLRPGLLGPLRAGHGRHPRPHRQAVRHEVRAPRCSAPDRETIEEAFPGDVVGLVNATDVQLGDTLYDAGDAGRRSRRSRASRPSSSPPPDRSTPAGSSSSARASPSSTRRAWCRCCATPTSATQSPILAAVGQMQFEVFALPPRQRVRRAGRDPARAVPGDPAHRRGVGARLREIGGIRILQPVRRRAGRPVREPLPPRPPPGRRARAHARTARRRRADAGLMPAASR